MTKQYFYRASVMYRLPTGGIEGTWFWCGVLRKMFLKKKLKGEGDLSLTKRMLGICSVSDNKWHFFYSINIWAFRNINCVHLFCYNVIKITLKLKKKEGKGRDWSSISDTLCDQYFTHCINSPLVWAWKLNFFYMKIFFKNVFIHFI